MKNKWNNLSMEERKRLCKNEIGGKNCAKDWNDLTDEQKQIVKEKLLMGKKRKKKGGMRDRVKQNAKESMSKGPSYLILPEGVELFDPEADKSYKLDILPYVVTDKKHLDPQAKVGELWYKKPIKIHYGVGADEIAILCPRTFGKSSPICEERNKVANDPDGDDETAKALKAKDRVLYCIRPLNGKQKDKICIWDISYYNFQELLDEELNDDDNEEYRGFPEPEDGYTLKVRFKEKKFGKNTFLRANKINFVEREDLDEEILEKVVNLDEILVLKSYDQIKKLFLELDDEDEDDEPDEKPKRKPKKVEEDEEPDDDEEDEKPKRQRKRPKKDEDEEDENKCPYNHTFGEDHEMEDECDKCKVVKKCEDAGD